MRIADFIEGNADLIADGAEAFAATMSPAGPRMDPDSLRDHIPEVLSAIVLDLRTPQSADEQHAKAQGRAPAGDVRKSAAMSYGRLRAKCGFDAQQMVAEYRALRAAVLRLWIAEGAAGPHDLEDVIRFNEAIDQAVAESVADFSAEADAWREVFLGVLGHDLRGPLSVIVTTSELMARMAEDTPFSAQTERIIQSSRRMSRLLDDLLEHSRSSLGMGIRVNRRDIDLRDALNEEITLLRAALPDAEIRFAASGATRGRFDGSRVREALHNLVTNAAKYGEPGTAIAVTLVGEPDYVEIEVRNRGAALSSRSLNALFEPLQRGPASPANGGKTSLGLGLFIFREIVRGHGGQVSATASVDETAFMMRLPVRPPDPEPAT